MPLMVDDFGFDVMLLLLVAMLLVRQGTDTDSTTGKPKTKEEGLTK